MRLVLSLLCFLALAAPASAHPGMAGMAGSAPADQQALAEAADKAFRKADANQDGSLSKEEFMAAYPSMRETAFTAIDTDKSGAISAAEWQDFSFSHSMGRSGKGSGMPMGGAMPPAKAGDQAPAKGDLPLIMPPAEQK